MIFKSLEYLDDPATGKICGLIGKIDERAITHIFIPVTSIMKYSWSVMIGDKCIRDIEDHYDGIFMTLYFDTDISSEDIDSITAQLTMTRNRFMPCKNKQDEVLVVLEVCTTNPGSYVLNLEEPNDRYLHDIIFHSRGGDI